MVIRHKGGVHTLQPATEVRLSKVESIRQWFRSEDIGDSTYPVTLQFISNPLLNTYKGDMNWKHNDVVTSTTYIL